MGGGGRGEEGGREKREVGEGDGRGNGRGRGYGRVGKWEGAVAPRSGERGRGWKTGGGVWGRVQEGEGEGRRWGRDPRRGRGPGPGAGAGLPRALALARSSGRPRVRVIAALLSAGAERPRRGLGAREAVGRRVESAPGCVRVPKLPPASLQSPSVPLLEGWSPLAVAG